MNKTKSRAITVLPNRYLSILIMGFSILILWAGLGFAQGNITKTHALNFFGTPKYGQDAPHLDYVNPNAPKGGEISIWAPGTFDSMNPYTRKGNSGALASAPYEALLEATSDEVGTSYGLLAESLEYPDDYSWVIFNIRPEARFSDGSEVTAEDALYTYNLFLTQGLPSYRAYLAQIVTGAEVLGPKQIKYTFSPDASPRSTIPIVGGLPVMQKKWFEDTGHVLDESRLEMPIGSAPYILESYDINRNVVYKRRDDYWGKDLWLNKGRSNFDRIRVEYFADSNAAFEGFKSGEYTFRTENTSKVWATQYDFPAINDGFVTKKTLPDGNLAPGQSYIFNLRRDKFQDMRVREALGLMFNFEWSNDSLFYGAYARINSFWENSDLAAVGTPTDAELALLTPLADQLPEGILENEAVMSPVSGPRPTDRKNLRAASKLLDESGWTVGDDGLRRNASGDTLRVEIMEDSPTFDRIHLPYIDNLKKLGVDAVYTRIDDAQFTERRRAFDYDMIVHSMPMSLEPSTSLKQYFGSETADVSDRNAMGLKSTGVDALIEHVITAENPETMKVAVQALDRALRAYKFWVPQWFNNTHRVAYWDMYEHPETLPPYSLGQLDFWWYNAEKAEALKASGTLR